MNAIWKYPLLITDEQTISVPATAIPVTVQMQDGVLCLWVLVDPDMELAERRVYMYGTGHPVPVTSLAYYVGTVQQGPFVWHVWSTW